MSPPPLGSRPHVGMLGALLSARAASETPGPPVVSTGTSFTPPQSVVPWGHPSARSAPRRRLCHCPTGSSDPIRPAQEGAGPLSKKPGDPRGGVLLFSLTLYRAGCPEHPLEGHLPIPFSCLQRTGSSTNTGPSKMGQCSPLGGTAWGPAARPVQPACADWHLARA